MYLIMAYYQLRIKVQLKWCHKLQLLKHSADHILISVSTSLWLKVFKLQYIINQLY